MDLLAQIEAELELSVSDSLRVFYFIQERERKILEAVQINLSTIL